VPLKKEQYLEQGSIKRQQKKYGDEPTELQEKFNLQQHQQTKKSKFKKLLLNNKESEHGKILQPVLWRRKMRRIATTSKRDNYDNNNKKINRRNLSSRWDQEHLSNC